MSEEKYEKLKQRLSLRAKAVRELEREAQVVVNASVQGGFLHSYYSGQISCYGSEAAFLERLMEEEK